MAGDGVNHRYWPEPRVPTVPHLTDRPYCSRCGLQNSHWKGCPEEDR